MSMFQFDQTTMGTYVTYIPQIDDKTGTTGQIQDDFSTDMYQNLIQNSVVEVCTCEGCEKTCFFNRGFCVLS